jgi:hypothetical protein
MKYKEIQEKLSIIEKENQAYKENLDQLRLEK